VSGAATVVVNYGPGTSTQVEIVMNEGNGQPGTVWDYTATIQPNASARKAGITKFGSRRLNLQGDGSYSGDVNIAEGLIRAQHDTALGLASTGTSGGTQTYSDSTTTVGALFSEVQTITVTGTTGTFNVTFNGQTTANLPFNIPAAGGTGPTASLQNALNALS